MPRAPPTTLTIAQERSICFFSRSDTVKGESGLSLHRLRSQMQAFEALELSQVVDHANGTSRKLWPMRSCFPVAARSRRLGNTRNSYTTGNLNLKVMTSMNPVVSSAHTGHQMASWRPSEFQFSSRHRQHQDQDSELRSCTAIQPLALLHTCPALASPNFDLRTIALLSGRRSI